MMADDFAARMKAKIEAQKRRASTLYEQSKRRIPEQYHDFLMLLPQNLKLGNFTAKGELEDIPGVASWDGKTFLALELPYVSVDGRVQMFRDEHKEATKKFRILFTTAWAQEMATLLNAAKGALDGAAVVELLKAVPEKLKGILVASVESEVYGLSQGSAKIGWDGEGVDRTNPYENAQTSALGRALAFMGYGLIGGGIASYEEVRAAVAEQETLEKKDAKARPPAPIKTEEVPKGNTVPAGSLQGDSGAKPGPEGGTTSEALPPAAPETPLDDPALALEKGPCADCGQPIPGAVQNLIKNFRKQGQAKRWSHNEVVKGMDCEAAAKIREQQQKREGQ